MAISTGGQSPALARKIRQDLADQFDAGYGTFLRLMGALRPLVIGLGLGSNRNMVIFRDLTRSPLLDAIQRGDQRPGRKRACGRSCPRSCASSHRPAPRDRQWIRLAWPPWSRASTFWARSSISSPCCGRRGPVKRAAYAASLAGLVLHAVVLAAALARDPALALSQGGFYFSLMGWAVLLIFFVLLWRFRDRLPGAHRLALGPGPLHLSSQLAFEAPCVCRPC